MQSVAVIKAVQRIINLSIVTNFGPISLWHSKLHISPIRWDCDNEIESVADLRRGALSSVSQCD